VGRKYYTVQLGHYEYKFNKEDLNQKSDYTPDYFLYFNKQQILDEQEINGLRQMFSRYFDLMRPTSKQLTLEQLRRINEIIKESELG
jgi:hypothetical protein